MATERIPIPQIALSALTLAKADFQDIVNQLGVQTLAVMGLSSAQGWVVHFSEGVIAREVPDRAEPAPARPAAPAAPSAAENGTAPEPPPVASEGERPHLSLSSSPAPTPPTPE